MLWKAQVFIDKTDNNQYLIANYDKRNEGSKRKDESNKEKT